MRSKNNDRHDAAKKVRDTSLLKSLRWGMANNPRHLRPQLTSIYSFLDYYAESMKKKSCEVFCFQVGANDGRTNDPVHKYFRDYGWKGLLVEPQADVFNNELIKTYANNKNVILENVALGKEEGQLSFYRVPDGPQDFQALIKKA